MQVAALAIVNGAMASGPDVRTQLQLLLLELLGETSDGSGSSSAAPQHVGSGHGTAPTAQQSDYDMLRAAGALSHSQLKKLLQSFWS